MGAIVLTASDDLMASSIIGTTSVLERICFKEDKLITKYWAMWASLKMSTQRTKVTKQQLWLIKKKDWT